MVTNNCSEKVRDKRILNIQYIRHSMISIVGGGPIGAYAASLLAREGKEVALYEEHVTIGEPVHCTGIVTNAISEIVSIPKKVIVNKVRDVRIYSPNNKFVSLKLKNPDFILDRKAFDRYLTEQAKANGATIFLNKKF